MTERPAWLLGDTGNVILTPAGARLVLAAMWRARQYHQAADGGAVVSADFAHVYQVVQVAARSTGSGTAGRTVRAVMPSSSKLLTVHQAAELRGVTDRAVRKAITSGRLAAQRHGRQWLISETDVRQMAPRRTDGSDHD